MNAVNCSSSGTKPGGLVVPSDDTQYTPIGSLKIGMKNLNLKFIVLEQIGRIFVTREGFEIRCLRVSDNSGSVNVSVWGKIGLELESGDICEAKNCYCNNWRNQLTLYIGKNGQLLRVGELMFAFQSQPYMSLIDFSNQPQSQNPDNSNSNNEINADNKKDSKNEK